jgi:hypothetical protein
MQTHIKGNKKRKGEVKTHNNLTVINYYYKHHKYKKLKNQTAGENLMN